MNAHNAELVQQGKQIVGLRLDGLDLVMPYDQAIEIRGSQTEVTAITITVLVDELTVTDRSASVSAAESAAASSTDPAAGPAGLRDGAR